MTGLSTSSVSPELLDGFQVRAGRGRESRVTRESCRKKAANRLQMQFAKVFVHNTLYRERIATTITLVANIVAIRPQEAHALLNGSVLHSRTLQATGRRRTGRRTSRTAVRVGASRRLTRKHVQRANRSPGYVRFSSKLEHVIDTVPPHAPYQTRRPGPAKAAATGKLQPIRRRLRNPVNTCFSTP
jgi:hypothetical protein